MNRKNTILIAVMINASLLAVLLVAALTSQDEVESPAPIMAEAPLTLPAFDDRFQESAQPIVTLPEPVKAPLEEVKEQMVHKLPPLAAPEPVAAAPSVQPAADTPSVNEVVVKKGDSLDKIAKAHKTTVSEIIKLNHLPSSFLKIGQVLKIPTERPSVRTAVVEKKTAEAGPEYYTMKVGENPWAIAMKHHMKVEELLRLNGLNEERARKLKPGDRLRIR